MLDIKKRNKELKTILSKEFGGKNVSGKAPTGTPYGWVTMTIKTPDPCPFKQDENPCSSYHACQDGVCKGNNKRLRGGWGDSVRQLTTKELTDRVEELIKDVEFYHYTSDDGYGTERREMHIDINFTRGGSLCMT